LQQAQQRVCRRTKGSRRRRRRTAVQLLARNQQKVKRQRTDFHHTAVALVRTYDTIDVQAIQPSHVSRRPAPKQDEHGISVHHGASQKPGLNTSIHAAGWRHFLWILADTAACAGKRVEAVSPAYTSQDCSGCGERIAKSLKSLSVRTHVCTTCGLVMDRDENAASTIVWRGQRLRGVAALAGMPAAVNREPVGL
jgi:putative transposase